jgi:hypothetical protein
VTPAAWRAAIPPTQDHDRTEHVHDRCDGEQALHAADRRHERARAGPTMPAA